ncbi:MAG TPA: hypothetical protein VK042_01900 [Atopostipes sp.]|nr:hypothetical protein [Atopostipes sp.]
MTQENEKVLGWDDEIQDSGPDFTLLPAGDYNFTVEKFERARHNGSANLPACPMALLTLKIDGGDHGDTTVVNRLFLHSKTEGFLSAFFESIGQKQEGERVRMNWQAVFGAKGRCKLEVNRYKSKDGEDRENNQVKTFLPYKEYQNHIGGNQPSGNTGQFQQQQTQQAPFPTGQPQQEQQPNRQQGGFTPGQF